MEKLAALQNEFENVKKRMDDDTKKAQRHEQKIKLLTNGYQMRAGKLWTQIEATFKQRGTAGTELECFFTLQTQEQLAATHRIGNLWEEVQKQKDLERTLQKWYGDLVPELEKGQHLIDLYRLRVKSEEIAADDHAHALSGAEAAVDECAAPDLETPVPLASTDVANSIQVITNDDSWIADA